MPTDIKRIFASPLARRLAGDAGLDLAGITGSGPNGRIVKADVLAVGAGAVLVLPGAVSSPVSPLPQPCQQPESRGGEITLPRPCV